MMNSRPIPLLSNTSTQLFRFDPVRYEKLNQKGFLFEL